MSTKQDLFQWMAIGFWAAVSFTSCGSHAPKKEDAFDLVKKERMISNDSSFASKSVIQESMKTEPVKKNVVPDSWTTFRLEMEKKILLNENMIKKIKDLPDQNASWHRQLEALENENNSLKTNMDVYREEEKVKWEMFQASQNHNVNEIAIELKSLKTNQKN